MLTNKQTQVLNLVGKVVRAKKKGTAHLGVLKDCVVSHPGNKMVCHVVDKDYEVHEHKASEIQQVPEL